MYKRIIEDLRQALDKSVEERDQKSIERWKEERWQFLMMIEREGKDSLLEIGAGTRVHAKFFHDQGSKYIATDLSPRMVERCCEKGLEAYEMDFMNLNFLPYFMEVSSTGGSMEGLSRWG
jgi:hypothetical protein